MPSLRGVLGAPLKDVDALRATRPDRIRYAPTQDEVRRLLPLVRNVGNYPTNLITTMGYVHSEALSVESPLDPI